MHGRKVQDVRSNCVEVQKAEHVLQLESCDQE